MMASLPNLPMEILLQILRECRSFTPKPFQNLRLVNKRISEVTTPFAFEVVRLDDDGLEPSWNQERRRRLQDRARGMLGSSLIDFARRLAIGPALSPLDPDDLDLGYMDEIWARCGDKIRRMDIAVADCGIMISRDDERYDYLDARFLWKLQGVLNVNPMRNLTHLSIEALTASVLFQLYDPTLRPRLMYEEDTYDIRYTEPRMYFPSLENLSMALGHEPSYEFECYYSIPDAVALLLTGCKKLASFTLLVKYTPYSDRDNYTWSLTNAWRLPGIFNFRDNCSTLTRLTLRLHVRFDDTSMLIEMLESLSGSLRHLSLSYIATRGDQVGPDWSAVFDLLASSFTDLREYCFRWLGNESHPIDNDFWDDYRDHSPGCECELVEAGEDGLRGLFDWINACAERGDLISASREEHAALDRLKEVVSRRRRSYSLPKHWDDGRLKRNYDRPKPSCYGL